ncbi:hypothetical protein [Flavobacterium sp.]|uniref:hypothetical protein n=1 Tax=Flavobacterium sp. TaxID=239 RepID=UPI00286D90DC|nr:hypothetical protein [Flavobacterium sp.]
MKFFLFLLVNLLLCIANYGQETGIFGNTNWLSNWTNFKPKTTLYPDSTNILSGVIDANLTLNKKNVYLISGIVYVTKNAILTIEPGTVIRGDYDSCGTLVITRGSKIMCEGKETEPIIFTSNKEASERKPGDWGGIIVLGGAPTNRLGGIGSLDFNLDQKFNIYGGTNDQDDSGVLKYVRIEFSGRKLNALKELNGLSLAGVGRKTKIEFLQISYSNDDSFEWYGGNVLVNNLISYRATDDDFDFTQGIQCSINNSIAIRHPFSSDASRSRCFEIDSYDKIEHFDASRSQTKIVAKNVTFVNNEDNDQGLVKEAIYVKKDSNLEIKNSIISGFSQCLILEDRILSDMNNLQKIKLENMVFHNCKGYIQTESNSNNKQIEIWYSNEKFNIFSSIIPKIDLFFEFDIKKTPDFRLKSSAMTTRLASN